MTEVAIYSALYILIFAFDIVPLIKSKRKKSLWVYLPIFAVTLAVNILFSIGTKIPNPTAPLKDLVSRMFGLS